MEDYVEPYNYGPYCSSRYVLEKSIAPLVALRYCGPAMALPDALYQNASRFSFELSLAKDPRTIRQGMFGRDFAAVNGQPMTQAAKN